MKMYEALLSAQKAINSKTCLNEILEQILDSVYEVFGLRQCAVLLLQDSKLRIAAARGYSSDIVSAWQGSLGTGITGTAALGQVVYVADVSKDSRYVQGVPGAVSELAVPIQFANEVLGVLDAESPRPFSREEQQWFTLFAGQIAIALRNAFLLDKEREKARQLKALASINARINKTGTKEQILEAILDTAADILHYDRSAILIYKYTHLEMLVSRGYKEGIGKGFRIPIGEGITGEAALRREGILVQDVRNDKRYIHASDTSLSEMAVPLFNKDELIGVLDTDSSSRFFSDDDYFIFTAFAEQIASVLNMHELINEIEQKNNALKRQIDDIYRINKELTKTTEALERANSELKKRIDELSTLYEVGKTITSSLNLEETLNTILDMTGHILNVSSGAIILLNDDASEMKVQALYTRDRETGLRYTSESSAPGMSSKTHGAAAAEEHGEIEPHNLSQELQSDKIIDIPLQIGERLIGKFRLAQRPDTAFTETERTMLVTLASQAAIAIENARLYENTQKAYFETIKSLAQALEARDAYTRGHSERVTEYSLLLAKKAGVSRKYMDILQYAGLLHDIGKIGVADAILLKPDKLSADDFVLIRDHTQLGDAILSPLRFLHDAQDIVKYHHERWDGTGYPEGLSGKKIPLLARIIAIADSFDAMTSDRPYRKAMPIDAAIEEIKAGAGTQFDPELASLFIEAIKEKFAV